MPSKEAFLIDASHWRWPTDLQNVLNVGAVGFITKATEGTTWVDDYYDDWQIQADQLDIPFGSFHYWRVAYDPRTQAQHYFDIATAWARPLFPPIIDVEKTYNVGVKSLSSASAHLQVLCMATEELWGEKPWIYTSYYSVKDMLGNPSWMGNFPLYVASYAPTPSIPVPWANKPAPQYELWQDTSTFKIPGTVFAGYDRDWWKGSLASYAAYIQERKNIINPPPPLPTYPLMGRVQLPANLNIFNVPMGSKTGLLPHATTVTVTSEVKDEEGIKWYQLGQGGYVKAKYIIPLE